MKDLITQVNAPAPAPEYPRSRIKDDSGLNDGVPVDENVYGDMHQFFQKAVTENKMFTNLLLDGRNAGYQLFDVIRHLAGYVSLYLHGLFDESVSTIGPGTGVAYANITVGQAQVFISDPGAGDVKSFYTEDGVQTLSYTSGLTNPEYIQEIFLPSAGYLLYVLDTAAPQITVFRVFDASPAPTFDIVASMGAPTSFFASPTTDRVYVVDSGNINAYVLSTSAHIPGESFGTSGDNYTDVSAIPSRDRIYILNQTQARIDVFTLSTGANVPGEQIGGLATPIPSFSIVARKAYVIENGQIQIYDLDTLGILAKESAFPAPLTPPTARSVFIRSGYMHLLEEATNSDKPIRCNAPTEYK